MINKKILLTISFFYIYFISFSQDTTIFINDYKLKLGFKLTSEKSNVGFEIEEGTKLYSGGIQLIDRINSSRSSIETGLYLLPTAALYYKDYIYTDPFGNTFYQEFSFAIQYYYLTIPINYRIDTKAFYMAGGLFFNHLLFRRGDYLNYADSIEDYKTDRKLNWGWNVALGLEKPVSNYINVFAEVKYVYTVSSFKTDGNFILNGKSLEASFTNYGISLGLNYKIKRRT